MKKGHIFFIMGVSGAGKGTLIRNLKQQQDLNLVFVNSYVTRPMREGEVDGNLYNFIDLDVFKKGVEAGEFLEYELNHGLHYYGTKYSDVVENGIEKGKKVLKEIEVKGLKNVFDNNPELKENITSIFLDISEEKLVERIEARGAAMSEEELENRKKSLKMEKVESKKICDYIIDTSDKTKEETLSAALEIIKNK